MRLAALTATLVLAACATAPPPAPAEPAHPDATIPTIVVHPPDATTVRCPTCGQPVPYFGPGLLVPSPPVGIAPPRALDAGKALRRASVGGKYRELLKKVAAPGDWMSYGAFCDWGFWTGTSYAGVNDLPPGHWVYVYPDWYVWKEPEGSSAAR